MTLVIACPSCGQKARVAEDMAGQSVKCPACSATFGVPTDAKPTTMAQPVKVAAVAEPELVVVRPPPPADIEILRSVRVGTVLQLVAQCTNALALAMLVILF